MNGSFPSSARLKESSAYDYVFQAPDHKSSDGYFRVLGRFSWATEHARLGLVVSKKQVKRAHERNRLKRLSREVFRLHYQAWQGKYRPMDFIVMAKHSAQFADNQALCQSLSRHFQYLHRNAHVHHEKSAQHEPSSHQLNMQSALDKA
ncbi:MAG: ribonuclease P protein component [Cardiobacteriaceae bacterium]|nr:ribonuclease P protein component [Cardiobacteriaceae bacterium]